MPASQAHRCRAFPQVWRSGRHERTPAGRGLPGAHWRLRPERAPVSFIRGRCRGRADGCRRAWTCGARPEAQDHAYAGIPIAIKDLADIDGSGHARRLAGPRRRRAGHRGCPGGSAPAARRLHPDRPHQHDRVRLFRPRHQSALRHAAVALRSLRQARARRIVVGCRRLGCRRHGAWRARHRHGRLVPHPGGVLRHHRLQADRAARADRRRRAAIDRRSTRSARWRGPSHAARRSMP